MKLLVVVDMQNDFITGPLGTKEAVAIVPKVIDKIRECEKEDTILIFTKDTHGEDYLETLEGKNLPVPHCIYMTEGWSINKEIASCAKAVKAFTYHSSSIVNSRILKPSFGSLDLARVIKEHADNLQEIVFVGLCTDICVISNAIMAKAAAPEVPVIVDASCCAGVTPEAHKTALEAMKMCQIKVINE